MLLFTTEEEASFIGGSIDQFRCIPQGITISLTSDAD